MENIELEIQARRTLLRHLEDDDPVSGIERQFLLEEYHSLCSISDDKRELVNSLIPLLDRSLSLSAVEKRRVITEIAGLSDFQLTELHTLFLEEHEKFKVLSEQHPDDISQLEIKRQMATERIPNSSYYGKETAKLFGIHLRSFGKSVYLNKPTYLSMLETILSMLLVLFLTTSLEFIYLLIPIVIAPMLLLRTDFSDEIAIGLLNKYSSTRARYVKASLVSSI